MTNPPFLVLPLLQHSLRLKPSDGNVFGGSAKNLDVGDGGLGSAGVVGSQGRRDGGASAQGDGHGRPLGDVGQTLAPIGRKAAGSCDCPLDRASSVLVDVVANLDVDAGELPAL